MKTKRPATMQSDTPTTTRAKVAQALMDFARGLVLLPPRGGCWRFTRHGIGLARQRFYSDTSGRNGRPCQDGNESTETRV